MARSVLRWQLRPGSRALSRAAMEVAFRGVRKILCVAEKNDAAKGIADLLSGGRMRRVRRRRTPRTRGTSDSSSPPGLPSFARAFAFGVLFRIAGVSLCGRASSAHSLENLFIPPFAPQRLPHTSDLANSGHRLAYG